MAAKKAAKGKAGAAKSAPVLSPSGDMTSLLEGLRDAIGEENAQLLGSDAMALKIRGVISTGCPTVDLAIGRGGIPLARTTILHGAEGSGKTTLASQIVANCQKAGGVAVYFDKEYKLDPDYAASLGVDPNKMIISQPPTLEKVLDGMLSVIELRRALRVRTGKQVPCVIVVDSINACTPKAVLEGDSGDSHVAPEARLWSRHYPKIVQEASREDVALVLISQVRKKIGVMFGSPDEIAGGQAPRFYASLIMRIARIGTAKDSDGAKTASKVEVECIKNQIAPPFRKGQFLIRYGKGVDFERSLVEAALKAEVLTIEKGGKGVMFEGHRLGTIDAAAKGLAKDAEWRDRLYNELKEAKGWS